MEGMGDQTRRQTAWPEASLPDWPHHEDLGSGRKGGESEHNGQGGEGTPLADWVPIPKKLLLRMGTMNVEVFKVFLWLIFCAWEHGGKAQVNRTHGIAQGAGLSDPMAERALKSLVRGRLVEQTQRGWRLLDFSPDDIE